MANRFPVESAASHDDRIDYLYLPVQGPITSYVGHECKGHEIAGGGIGTERGADLIAPGEVQGETRSTAPSRQPPLSASDGRTNPSGPTA